MSQPTYQRENVTLYEGDCLPLMRAMGDNSVDLIVTDPPYFRVKGEAWDRQWDKPEKFIAWIGELCKEWQRILKPNGSLYVFASPQMASRVECAIAEQFNVVNSITWAKPGACYATKYGPENFRGYVEMCERVVFAEHFNADNIAKGEAGYQAKCDELRGFVFEPLRAYLAEERDRAGFTTRQVAEAFQRKTGSRTVTGMAGHWFERVQWALPTEANYLWLRELFNSKASSWIVSRYPFLDRPYEELRAQYEELRAQYEELRAQYEELRAQYESLRVQYEELRRPFQVTAEVPYTDVWTYPTVPHYPGKHPCEKPLAMMLDIIRASSREGATVMDCFVGSGVVMEACRQLGRVGIGMDLDLSHSLARMAKLDESSALFDEVAA